jgi:hypothetical protein
MCSHRATALELTVSVDWELGSLVAARSRLRTEELW